jgi:hypothetical protein
MQNNTAENRRKESRVSVAESVYVVINTKPQTLGQMVEISTSGLAFTFVDLNNASKRISDQPMMRVDLFAGGKGLFVKDLICRVISKIENVSDPSLSSFAIKRVGIEFEDLTLPQQVQINRLVKRQDELTH